MLQFTPEDFAHSLECPTRLHHARTPGPLQERWHARQRLQSQSLASPLLKGLAIFKYHPDPLGANAIIEVDDPQMAIWETRKRLNRPGRVVLANAAVQDGERFARVDVMVHDAAHNTIEIIDVLPRRASPGTLSMRFSDQWYDWRGALYALAFKAVVTARHFRGNQVVAKLVLPDESQSCDLDDLRRLAWLEEDAQGITRVRWREGLRASDLGSLRFLREVDVSRQVNALYNGPVDVPGVANEHRRNLDSFITWATDLHQRGVPAEPVASRACASCAFRAMPGQDPSHGCHAPVASPAQTPSTARDGSADSAAAQDRRTPVYLLATASANPSVGLRKGQRAWQWTPFQFTLQRLERAGDGTLQAGAPQAWKQLDPSPQQTLDFLRALQQALAVHDDAMAPAPLRHTLDASALRQLNATAHNAPVSERQLLRALVDRLASQASAPIDALPLDPQGALPAPPELAALPWVGHLFDLQRDGHLAPDELPQALFLRSQWAALSEAQRDALGEWLDGFQAQVLAAMREAFAAG